MKSAAPWAKVGLTASRRPSARRDDETAICEVRGMRTPADRRLVKSGTGFGPAPGSLPEGAKLRILDFAPRCCSSFALLETQISEAWHARKTRFSQELDGAKHARPTRPSQKRQPASGSTSNKQPKNCRPSTVD